MQKIITKEKVFLIIEFIELYYKEELQVIIYPQKQNYIKTHTVHTKCLQALLVLIVLSILKVENYKIQGNKSLIYTYIAEYYKTKRTVIYNLLKRHIIEFKEVRSSTINNFFTYYKDKKQSSYSLKKILFIFNNVIDELYFAPDSKLYYNKLIETYKTKNLLELGSIVIYENKKYYLSGFVINEKKEILINIIDKKTSLLIKYKAE